MVCRGTKDTRISNYIASNKHNLRTKIGLLYFGRTLNNRICIFLPFSCLDTDEIIIFKGLSLSDGEIFGKFLFKSDNVRPALKWIVYLPRNHLRLIRYPGANPCQTGKKPVLRGSPPGTFIFTGSLPSSCSSPYFRLTDS